METQEKRVGVFMQLYRNEPTMHKAIQIVLEQTYTKSYGIKRKNC